MKRKNFVLLIIAALLLALNRYGILDIFSYENMNELKTYINSFGLMAPLAFIIIFIIATVLFVPGLPITVLAGILFGAWLGTVYVIIGSTIGVSITFFIGRYVGRDFVTGLVKNNNKMAKLDKYIKEQGKTILIISRLVPVFPFNLQNYAYGITDISFKTYLWYSFIFMIPGTFIYTAFGALAYSAIPTEKFVMYSSLLLVCLCTLILLPKIVFKEKIKSIK